MASERSERDFAKKNRPTIVEVEDVSVSFAMDRGESRVLDNVNIDVKRDEILGVVGESGSGKSMFASALLDAVVKPGILTGDITYHPREGDPIPLLDLDDDELNTVRWEEIAFVFQGAQSSFNPTMTVRSHFVETLKAHDYDTGEGIERARELLSELYLEPERVLESYPHELSGGMKQRALIALSLILRPQMLVMDEPTAALDLLMQRSILNLLQNLQERYDLTVVFITHDLQLVAGLADRLSVMYSFEFVEIGTAERIMTEPKHPYTRALLNAVPNLTTPLSEMDSIPGSSPDPVNIPEGCSYHPRCPLADERCTYEDPSLLDVGEDHKTACHYWDRSSEELPLKVHTEDSTPRSQARGNQSEEPVVSLSDVDVYFETNTGWNPFSGTRTVQAVDGVSLDVFENDVVALVGESGCGKTTLGKTAIGIIEPTGGAVEYRGEDVWKARRRDPESNISFREIRRALQIVHQDPGSSLNPNRTVQAILAAPLKKWRPDMNRGDRRSRILGMLEHVGMTPPDDYATRYPHQLSGGEQQRVALIRALLMNPDLILADEAVSALDVSLRVEMMDLMLELQEIFNTSYLFISHNLSNARYFAGNVGGRIGVMYLGQIVEIGPAEEIVSDPRHPYTQVLKWATADMEVREEAEKPPIRDIDIPDPVNPPSGCRFHPRCPEAREICRKQAVELDDDGEGSHLTACFRARGDDHPYWESSPLHDGVNEASAVASKAKSD